MCCCCAWYCGWWWAAAAIILLSTPLRINCGKPIWICSWGWNCGCRNGCCCICFCTDATSSADASMGGADGVMAAASAAAAAAASFATILFITSVFFRSKWSKNCGRYFGLSGFVSCSVANREKISRKPGAWGANRYTFHSGIFWIAVYHHCAQIRFQLNHRSAVRHKGAIVNCVINHGAILTRYQGSCVWWKFLNRARIHLIVIVVLRNGSIWINIHDACTTKRAYSFFRMDLMLTCLQCVRHLSVDNILANCMCFGNHIVQYRARSGIFCGKTNTNSITMTILPTRRPCTH